MRWPSHQRRHAASLGPSYRRPLNRRFVLKAIHERLAISAATPPMPYRLLKLRGSMVSGKTFMHSSASATTPSDAAFLGVRSSGKRLGQEQKNLMPVMMIPMVIMMPSIVVPRPVVARSIVVISRRVVVARPIVIRSKWRSGDSARGIDRGTGDTKRPFQGKGAVLSVGR